MTNAALYGEIEQKQEAILVDETFPHAPHTVWKALTDGDLMSRWMLAPKGFAPIEGTHFTFQTKPAGAWDGTIRCQVLEVQPNERFAYSWKGGDAGNAGYGSPLDTVVTWTLTSAGKGTRVQLVHSGFALPRNETAFRNMSGGWEKVVPQLGAMLGDEA